MKLVCSRIACIAALLLTLALAASANPPTLTPIEHADFPTEVAQGHPYTFSLKYQQDAGDKPTALKMVLETPGGEVIQNVPAPSGDPAKGIDVTWNYTPASSGSYQYHFEATSAMNESVRYPATAADDPKFVSANPYLKWVYFAVGTLVALVFLPFVVYVGTRAANKRGDPAAASRVALLVGVMASYGLLLYLFSPKDNVLLSAMGGIVALAILIVLFTRK